MLIFSVIEGLSQYVSGGNTFLYGKTSYRANGGSRPIFASSASNDGVFMAIGPNARKASSAPTGICTSMRDLTDGTTNTVMSGEHLNLDSFQWNSLMKSSVPQISPAARVSCRPTAETANVDPVQGNVTVNDVINGR